MTMNCCCILLLATGACLALGQEVDLLEDFPLDSQQEDDQAAQLNNLEEGTGEVVPQDLEETAKGRQELLKRVVTAAMARPGARQRLAQVLPIVRTMSPPQRLAMAALVMTQVMASPNSTTPLNAQAPNLTAELMLPISMDIASMFTGLGREASSQARSAGLRIPELYPRPRPPAATHYRRPPPRGPPDIRRSTVHPDLLPPPPPPQRGGVHPPRLSPPLQQHSSSPIPPPTTTAEPDMNQCESFSDNLCLEVSHYPGDAIMESIEKTENQNTIEVLRTDSQQDSTEIDNRYYLMERRQGEVSPPEKGGGQMCASRVELARPKRARATSGQWKYIVNTGDYTQTLRLEMCLKPQQSCSFLSDNFKSECTQVYNYHRLLTWDQTTGLTMDIFKVPTCCSCHVQGYSYAFPPADKLQESIHPDAFSERPEANFIAQEQTAPLQQHVKPGLVKVMRPSIRPHNIPKRESAAVLHSRRPPPIHHRGPPLPLEERAKQRVRYPPYEDNQVRRSSPRNESDSPDLRPPVYRPSPNQRHPELPADSLHAASVLAPHSPAPPPTTMPRPISRPLVPVSRPPTPVSRPPPISVPRPSSMRPPPTPPHQGPPPQQKRVNYSYHPIIDFFSNSASASVVDDRNDRSDWTPITDGPRVMPK